MDRRTAPIVPFEAIVCNGPSQRNLYPLHSSNFDCSDCIGFDDEID